MKILVVAALFGWLALPCLGAFVGALIGRILGGMVGLFSSYLAAMLLLLWFATFMLVPSHEPPQPWTTEMLGFLRWVVQAYAESWPWHLGWIGVSVLCLVGGLWLRERRSSSM